MQTFFKKQFNIHCIWNIYRIEIEEKEERGREKGRKEGRKREGGKNRRKFQALSHRERTNHQYSSLTLHP